MANSSIITEMKQKVMQGMCQSELLFHAIDSTDITDFEDSYDLIGTHIFGYHRTPDILMDTKTCITVQVQIPNISEKNKAWVKPMLEIWIYSHESCMNVQTKDKKGNRIDSIAEILDELFNNRTDFCFGRLKLESNTEGILSKEFPYRQMIFEATDFNQKMCG